MDELVQSLGGIHRTVKTARIFLKILEMFSEMYCIFSSRACITPNFTCQQGSCKCQSDPFPPTYRRHSWDSCKNCQSSKLSRELPKLPAAAMCLLFPIPSTTKMSAIPITPEITSSKWLVDLFLSPSITMPKIWYFHIRLFSWAYGKGEMTPTWNLLVLTEAWEKRVRNISIPYWFTWKLDQRENRKWSTQQWSSLQTVRQ